MGGGKESLGLLCVCMGQLWGNQVGRTSVLGYIDQSLALLQEERITVWVSGCLRALMKTWKEWSGTRVEFLMVACARSQENMFIGSGLKKSSFWSASVTACSGNQN